MRQRKRKLSSTPADLEQWLKDHNACVGAKRKFKGLTFQQAWERANESERLYAIDFLMEDGAIRGGKKYLDIIYQFDIYDSLAWGSQLRASALIHLKSLQTKLVQPERIGFYDNTEQTV